jgi:hypothetical protein
MDQMKKAFKGLFKKKSKKEESKPTATTDTPASAAHGPEATKTETAPAPEPAKTEPTPAKTATATESTPAQPAPASAPGQGEANKDEVAALAEIKKATQSRSSFSPTPQGYFRNPSASDGSRWRHRAAADDSDSDSGGAL